ncbi:MAG: flagellar assembly protein FliH, partial [Epsilonproteobacteria bacterium]|nr:flagellar assembly protein FliH [Campylobacterota bacterium]
MADNIIDKDRIDDHSIQRYRFKVLGTNGNLDAIVTTQDEYMQDAFEPQEIKTPSDEVVTITRIEEGAQNQFIEELLKKTDELTSNVVKLQIQIEKQEQDFSKRLTEELTRERENAYAQGYQKAKDESESVLSEIKSR